VSALLQLQLQIDATRTAVAQLSATPTQTPAALPTNTRIPATPTPRRVSPIVEVLVEGLNIRSGPGTGYPVVASGAIGQRFPVIGQSGNCAWLHVVLDVGISGLFQLECGVQRIARRQCCSGADANHGAPIADHHATPGATCRPTGGDAAARACRFCGGYSGRRHHWLRAAGFVAARG
jgi:hypothetical protein